MTGGIARFAQRPSSTSAKPSDNGKPTNNDGSTAMDTVTTSNALTANADNGSSKEDSDAAMTTMATILFDLPTANTNKTSFDTDFDSFATTKAWDDGFSIPNNFFFADNDNKDNKDTDTFMASHASKPVSPVCSNIPCQWISQLLLLWTYYWLLIHVSLTSYTLPDCTGKEARKRRKRDISLCQSRAKGTTKG
jgi:hypothetical protein